MSGFRIGEQVDAESLKASTYPVLLRQLLDKSYDEYLSYEDIDRVGTELYGEDWEEIIRRAWKHAPDVEVEYSDVLSVTDVHPVHTQSL